MKDSLKGVRTQLLFSSTPIEHVICLASLLDKHSAESCFHRLGIDLAQNCTAAYEQIQKLSSSTRRAYIADLTQELFSPLPACIDRVHPSWIQHLLDDESPAIVAVAVEALSAVLVRDLRLPPLPLPAPKPNPLARRWVYQLVWGALAAMPPEADGEPRPLESWDELPTWSPDHLRQALIHLGCLTLGALINRAGPATGATLQSQLRDTPYFAMIQTSIDHPIPLPRTLRPPALDQQHPEQLLLQLGMQSSGPCLPQPCRRQTAQLMPRGEGLILLAGEPGNPQISSAMLSSLQRADGLAS